MAKAKTQPNPEAWASLFEQTNFFGLYDDYMVIELQSLTEEELKKWYDLFILFVFVILFIFFT